ncbi:hypothetical protein BOQ60_24200 [Chryseobacterium sp. CH1]|nr:hypothetical protein BOQ60_24200 [Chryseobacterium sp. CH1]
MSQKFNKNELDSINQKLKNLGISNTELIIKQDATDIKSEILNELGQRNSVVSEKDLVINSLRQQLDRYTVKDSSLIKEINILFPDFHNISIGRSTNFPNTDSANVSTVILYKSDKEEKEQNEKMKQWISEKLSDKKC